MLVVVEVMVVSVHWNRDATARGGWSEQDLLRLSGADTEAVIAPWRANLMPTTTPTVRYAAKEIRDIVQRHPALFAKAPSRRCG